MVVSYLTEELYRLNSLSEVHVRLVLVILSYYLQLSADILATHHPRYLTDPQPPSHSGNSTLQT